jgi:azurin
VKGWFGNDAYANNAVVSATVGTANLERDGVAFSVDEDTVLPDGDVLSVGSGSTLTITAEDNTFTLNEETQVTILTASEKAFGMNIDSGEVFAVVDKASALDTLSFDEKTITVQARCFW